MNHPIKKLLFIVLLIAVSCSPKLQNTTPASTVNSLLWKISKDGVQPSYVYGTFHLLPQADFQLSEKVQQAFGESEQIVLELDMDQEGMQMEMLKYMSMTDGTTISSLLPEEDYQKLDSILTSTIGMGLAMMDTWKPFFISTFLLTSYIEGTPASFEMSFVQMAKEQEKEILGLETIAEQMAAVDKMDYRSQTQMISEMLNEEDKMRKSFREMLDLYKNEDVEGLYAYTKAYMENPEEIEAMITNRNESWISRIGEIASDKSTFFGVGAGHLGGEKGVISLLKEAGYEVEAVR
ncbi:MAG: TraB/GumN family protein [Bacteroidota bacterium]